VSQIRPTALIAASLIPLFNHTTLASQRSKLDFSHPSTTWFSKNPRRREKPSRDGQTSLRSHTLSQVGLGYRLSRRRRVETVVSQKRRAYEESRSPFPKEGETALYRPPSQGQDGQQLKQLSSSLLRCCLDSVYSSARLGRTARTATPHTIVMIQDGRVMCLRIAVVIVRVFLHWAAGIRSSDNARLRATIPWSSVAWHCKDSPESTV